jgi:F-type H+-transporting ATPase subunit b
MMLHDPQLWILVSFLLFVAICGRRFYRIVSLQLDDRSLTIARQIKEVAELYAEAQRILSNEKTKFYKTREFLTDLEKQTQEEAKKILQETQEKITLLKKTQTQELENRFQVLQKKMHLDIQDSLLQKSCALVRNSVSKKSTKAQQDHLLKQQMKNLSI